MKTFHAFCIAAPRSGEGKTMISLALMRLLTRKSMHVQAFKCGPDYIDPTFHSLVTGRTCANLDTWMMGEGEVQRVFSTKSHDANISICEGVMGLFDGKIHKKNSETKDTQNKKNQNKSTLPPIDGSSAHCAKTLNIPIVLVVNAKGMASSIAALVAGFVLHAQKYELQIAGIIANNVGSSRHAKILEDALLMWKLPSLLGFLPRKEEWRIQERQLGLLPYKESEKDMVWADSIADILEENLDVDNLLKLTQIPRPPLSMGEILPTPFLPPSPPSLSESSTPAAPIKPIAPLMPIPAEADLSSKSQAKYTKGVLAIARDEAFCFYYEANIKALEYIGWKIIYFSPLHDKHLPKADALYLGGGYPEIFAKQLTENQNMRKEIYDFAMANGEIFAECGGYMYLTKELLVQNASYNTAPTQSAPSHDTLSEAVNLNEYTHYPMCGVINGVASMGKRMRSLGYREIDMQANTIFYTLPKPHCTNSSVIQSAPSPVTRQENAQISQAAPSHKNLDTSQFARFRAVRFRGHEFHWSDIELQEDYAPVAFVNGVAQGVAHKNVRASYLHFYWANTLFSPKTNA